jgi:molecular chaperone HtpG
MSEAIKYIDTLDDWKSEFLPRLQKSYIYSSLETECNNVDIEVITLLHEAVAFSIQRTKTIISHMKEYTLHDDIHLFRVLYLMERLLTKEVIQNLSIPERMLLILSAFLHDIGMAPDEKEIKTWKKVWDSIPEIDDDEEQKLFDRFKRFYDARPEQQEVIDKLVKEGNDSKASILKSYLLTDFIRQTHAERAREIVANYWNGRIKYRDTDLTLELANICQSHNEDALKLLNFEKDYPCGNNSYVCLPLLGVILRLADILDFDAKRTPLVLYSHLYVRNPISIVEWQKHRAIENWEINPSIIQFSAKCEHPAIEASIHGFCDLIDHELSICNNILTSLNEFNQAKSRAIQVKIPFQVTRDKIKTQKDILNNKPIYTYRDTKFNLSKRQVIDLLMGTKLYGNPEVALRELLQNSIDACQLRNAQEEKWGYSKYEPEITVKYYTVNGEDILEVIDNGTGMDQDIIDNYYSRVGSSFYKSTEFYTLKSETNADFTPRSRFGIGVLSCFMVADILIVDTKRKKGPEIFGEAINISVEGQESIFWIKPGQREVSGTTTKLILRKGINPWERMSEDEFINSVEKVIPNPPFKINIETTKIKKTRDENSFSEVTAVSFKDNSWREHENIKYFEIKLDYIEIGFVGSAIVAILETLNRPVNEVSLTSKDIPIDGTLYTLERKLLNSENSIEEISKTITIDENANIKEKQSYGTFTRSKSKISLHGIEIPANLFAATWELKANQVRISWPFPLVIVIDICGNRDLDLNSPRTEIIMSEKWINFEEELAFQICNSIAENVSVEYWNEWKKIISEGNKNEQFLRGLNKVEKK